MLPPSPLSVVGAGSGNLIKTLLEAYKGSGTPIMPGVGPAIGKSIERGKQLATDLIGHHGQPPSKFAQELATQLNEFAERPLRDLSQEVGMSQSSLPHGSRWIKAPKGFQFLGGSGNAGNYLEMNRAPDVSSYVTDKSTFMGHQKQIAQQLAPEVSRVRGIDDLMNVATPAQPRDYRPTLLDMVTRDVKRQAQARIAPGIFERILQAKKDGISLQRTQQMFNKINPDTVRQIYAQIGTYKKLGGR